jgi:hypothetical protein
MATPTYTFPAYTFPAYTFPAYTFHEAHLIPSTTRFYHTVEQSSSIAELTAIEIHVINPEPPLDTLLEELGTLRISIGAYPIQSIPIILLASLGTLTRTGNRITISFDFSMFVDRFVLTQPITVYLETLSTTHVSRVRFMVSRGAIDEQERHLLTYGDYNIPLQQIQTQTRQASEPVQHFAFRASMTQGTKGFFVEGTLQDISSVRLTMTDRELWLYYAGELSVLARPVTDRYLFIPFHHRTDMRSTSAGAFAGHGSIELMVTYNRPRYQATVHALVSQKLTYRAGVLQHRQPSRWTTTTKALNPDRSTCPITYETITGDYCECDTCHYAFDSTSLQNYVASRPEDPSCPTCRSPWTNRTVYQQPIT